MCRSWHSRQWEDGLYSCLQSWMMKQGLKTSSSRLEWNWDAELVHAPMQCLHHNFNNPTSPLLATSGPPGAYRVWWSAGMGPWRWPWRSATTGEPMLFRGLVPVTSSFLKDWRTGELLSMGTPWGGTQWGGPPWMSIIRTSAIRWGDGGGVLEPKVGSWLFLDFCLYREGWSIVSVGLGPL